MSYNHKHEGNCHLIYYNFIFITIIKSKQILLV
jgi:hypothetical protein